jgi:short-subunit dehydrogenase
MRTIVITGSTRGIGYGLAGELLERSCHVVISGRDTVRLAEAEKELVDKFGQERILAVPCDVTDTVQVQAFWNSAKERFGRVDIWVNNAGTAHMPVDFLHLAEGEWIKVIDTNIIGTMNGDRVALTGMLEQGGGAIYNFGGFGSSGSQQYGMSIYGTSKYAIEYFTRALVKETKGKPVIIGFLQPGMVATDMLSRKNIATDEEWDRAKKIFNIFADPVEAVAPWLADKILTHTKHGARFSRSSTIKVLWRFLASPFQKRDLYK